jgi:hypothetical protein
VYVLVQFSDAVPAWNFAAAHRADGRVPTPPPVPPGPREAEPVRDEVRFNDRIGPRVPRGSV